MPDPEIEAIREILKSQPRPDDHRQRRARLDALGTRYPVAPDVRIDPVDANGVPAEWTTAPTADTSRVVMFLHGGGYMAGSIASHRHMVSEVGRQAGARGFAVEYRLAPEHPYPAALNDALAAYRYLLSAGYTPGSIALAGESAGGGLALATAVSLRDAGQPLPACLWCSSPWTDLQMTGRTMTIKSEVDPLIQKPYLQELATAYLQGADPCAPLVSPLHADLRRLPPVLIQVGSAETLLDDSTRLAAVLGEADVAVRLEIWPDMIHAWHLFYQQLAAGRQALAAVGAFVRARLT